MPLQPSPCQASEWVSFLRQYGPIHRNDSMYDETIQRTLKRKKIQPLVFDTEYLGDLLDNFNSVHPKSIILTGTAGDGKTYYCREIWERLGGSPEEWNLDHKVYSLKFNGKHIIIVRDLSGLTYEQQRELLPQIADSITGKSQNVYLIAANDGQLVEALLKRGEIPEVLEVRQVIEDLLIEDKREKEGFNVKLYNLSRQSAAVIFPRILDAVLNHPGWGECDGCFYKEQGCSIWENRLRLSGTGSDQSTRARLTDLLTLCELNEMHLPVRQLLLLVANTLLGHPGAKERLLTCQQIPKINQEEANSLGSLYRNIFGENLTERKREVTEVFKVLRRFGIGAETSSQIDNILIFGGDDLELQPLYKDLVLSDSFYGADLKYQSQQRSYLEGDAAKGRKEFLDALHTQRQRLFFTIPGESIADLKLWNLTVFHYAGEYLNHLYRFLQEGEKAPKYIISRLVKGLNRIFTGLLVGNQDELILATSGSYSQAKISRVHEESISTWRKRGEYVDIVFNPESKKLNLLVHLSSSSIVAPALLQLNLTRYEYLSRVAEGALPSNFSQECYEDLLAFKAQILKQLMVRRATEEDLDADENSQLRLLELNPDGTVIPRPMEIYL